MRLLAVITLILAGCYAPVHDPVIVPPPEPVKSIELMKVWQDEVLQDAAIFLAVRPSLAGPAPALSLYDSATQGLISLAGEPSSKDVERFKGLVIKPDQKELDKLRAEKVALDKKTDELERQVGAERDARLKAEAEAVAAKEAAAQAKIEARKSEAVSMMTKVGAIGAGIGLLALLFGHYVKISKLTAGLVIASSLGIAVAAPWLIDLAEMKVIIVSLLAFLGTDVAVFIVVKTWRLIRREKETPAS